MGTEIHSFFGNNRISPDSREVNEWVWREETDSRGNTRGPAKLRQPDSNIIIPYRDDTSQNVALFL